MSELQKTNIRDWLQRKIAEEAGEKIESISLDADFESFRLDSLSLLSIAYDLENEINLEINPTDLIEYNTINKLAEWIESKR